jgi:MoaA/NifB/PqqE/SkfB family radical SAM enzyme
MNSAASSFQEMVLRGRLASVTAKLVWKYSANPREATRVAQQLSAHWAWQRERVGKSAPVRMDSGWVFRPMLPRVGSPAFERLLEGMISRFMPGSEARPALQLAMVSITRRCGLSCQHCSAWEELDQVERMSLDELIEMVRALQDYGVGVIHFTGGEPLARFDDLLALLKSAQDNTDFWIATSGLGLTHERAIRLREAGLVGAYVSVDHVDPAVHDVFRGREGSFQHAMTAAAACREAGLGLGLSLCPTRAFTTRENLSAYYRMAAELDAGWIRIVEPKAAGRWKGQDVALDAGHREVLDEFLAQANRRELGEGPIVYSPDHVSRQLGCGSNGVEAVYVDSEGMVRSCPFCTSRGASVEHGVENAIKELRAVPCKNFRKGQAPLTWPGVQPGNATT